MALEPIVESLEQVDEAYRGIYIEKDGKYQIDVKGGLRTEADVDKLQEVAAKERAAAKASEKKAKAADEKYNAIDFKRIEGLEANARELEEAGLKAKGDIEGLVKTRMEPALKKQARVLEAKDAELKKEQERVAELKSQNHTFIVGSAIRDAAAPTVKPTAVEILLDRAAKCWKVSEDGTALLVDEKGEPVYSAADPMKPMDPGEWVEGFREKHGYLFKESVGGGAPGSQATGRPGEFVMTAEQAKNFGAFESMSEEAAKVGKTVQIVR